MIYNKKCIFDLCPSSWHRVPQTLINSQVKRVAGASFVLMRQLWVGPWMAPGCGLVTRKTKPWLKVWYFQPLPPHHSSERGERLETELIIDNTYLRKPPWNPNSVGFGELPGWWTHIPWRVIYTNSMGKLLHSEPTQTSSYVSLHLTVYLYHILLKKLLNISECSLSSVSCFSKLIKTKGGGLW